MSATYESNFHEKNLNNAINAISIISELNNLII